MSTRVVNNSMKKPEAEKSSKVVVNTGYELVQPTKGRKSSSTSGYHVPDTRAVGGYELVKIPTAKRTAVTQNVSVYERPTDKEIAKPKRDVVLVVAVIVVVVITVVTILSVTIAFFIISEKEPLPDLTELCRAGQYLPEGVDSNCYYHVSKYPTQGCAETECVGTVDQLNIDRHSGLTHEVDLSAIPLTKIPNQTPCAPGKWCQEGVCIETKDSRVKEYDEMKAVHSYWVNSCEHHKCIHIHPKFTLKFKNLNGECIDENECRLNPDIEKVAFGYRYRTIPRYDGDIVPLDELPIHVIKNCGHCSSTVNNNNLPIKEKCSQDDAAEKLRFEDNGVPCLYKDGSIGFCFYGECLSDGSKDQKCLTETNSAKN